MASLTKNGITLSSDSGNGNATITISATPNTSPRPKVVYFTISANPELYVAIKVVQAGAGATNIGGETSVTNPDIKT